MFIKKMMQLGVNYRGKKSVQDDAGWWWNWWGIGPKAGDRAYDGDLEGGKRVLDLLSDGTLRYVLLAFGTGAWSSVSIYHSISSQLEQEGHGELVKCVAVVPSHGGGAGNIATSLESWELVKDCRGKVHKAYCATSTSPCLYLVRPDGYIG